LRSSSWFVAFVPAAAVGDPIGKGHYERHDARVNAQKKGTDARAVSATPVFHTIAPTGRRSHDAAARGLAAVPARTFTPVAGAARPPR